MNSRGPLPQPDSRDGQRGVNGAAAEFIQEMPTCPSRLKDKKLRAEFVELIDSQMAAGVGIRKSDGELYARYIVARNDFWQANSPSERQSAQRVMSGLEQQLVIGELHRQRVGIRGKTVKPKSKFGLTEIRDKKRDQPATPTAP